MNSRQKKSEVSFFNANFTSIISVALLLVVLGIVAIFMLVGKSLSDSIRNNVGFTVVVDAAASDADINDIKRYLNDAPFVQNYKFVSADDALAEWKKDTGEDLMELLGANPLSGEFDVRLNPNYSHSDSIETVAATVSQLHSVAQVDVQKEMIKSVNDNLRKISIALLVVSLALVIISFALINNTVQLAVYSKRFLIHTMKLVGATSSFIRRPFIVSNVINGMIAAIIADVVLAVGIYYGLQFANDDVVISTEHFVALLVAIFIIGVIICAVAASMAASKYIRLDYDALFKR